MLAQERQEEILRRIREQKNIKTSEIMQLFNVSSETVRRDLDYLEGIGCLKKVYGGAILTKKLNWEPPLHERALINKKEKEEIAVKCAEIINDDEIIFIDSGTTPFEVVKRLTSRKNLTIFTISLLAADFIIDNLDARCIILGGEVRKKERSLNGPIAEAVLSTLHFDKAVLSAGGIHPSSGLTDYDLNDVSIKKKIVQSADEIIVAADSSKFGVKALAQVAPLTDLSIIVTDNNLGNEWRELFLKGSPELVIADSNE